MPACWRSFVFHDRTLQMCRRNVQLDEVKQTPVESRQSRGPLVCDEPTPVLTADYCSVNWRACSWSGDIRPWPENSHWCRPGHADTCTANCTVSRCFTALRQLCQIRHSVPPCPSRWWSLVLSRLDYGNAVLVGIPAYLVRRLQSVLNAAALLIYHMRSADHITAVTALLASVGCASPSGSSTRSLCWRTKSYRGLRHGTRDPLLGSHISQVDEHCALSALVAFWCHPSSPQQSAAGSSQLLVPVSGTRCRKRRHQHHHWRFSVNVWKPGLSDNLILISLSDLTYTTV